MVFKLGLLFGFFPIVVQGQGGETRQEVLDRMQPYTGEHHAGVDVTTLKGKVMCGYQGWFSAKGDGSGRGWVHYGTGHRGHNGHKVFEPGHCTIDLWPDVRELAADEKFATRFHHPNGDTAYVFSSYKRNTVLRHFKWMKEYKIDGVFLQRFGSALRQAKSLHHRNVVTANVQAGANLHGRSWAMMYDLSGLQPGEIDKLVIEDWKQLIDRMKITGDKSYQRHKGKPVVAVWGVGFSDDRKYTLSECEKLVNFLKTDKRYGGNAVMLGVPTHWRNLSRDSVQDEKLHRILSQADIVSPWTVGRYRTPQQAKLHAESMVRPDIDWVKKNRLDYLPVVFPGFSWQNLQKARGRGAKLDQIPRLGGQFLWSQARSFKQAGAEMLYVAMFDEIDEGTAIFKCSNKPPQGESRFLTYQGFPSDHYLWLTGKVGSLLRNEIPATEQVPPRNGR
ncbi:xylosidase/arabinosidase [Verrucomicrobiaceae bacterium N1E253]|uniref:Xylosidase/arabinosidase n=1 Tax=Oceaniferula marina TaxID=2748318 RepID=A0A851GLQ1_9BACT|nr:xylosidase/arabinosidase [Oceaniferula marina]